MTNRQRFIMAFFDCGGCHSEIARQFGVTRAYVGQLLNKEGLFGEGPLLKHERKQKDFYVTQSNEFFEGIDAGFSARQGAL